MDNINDNSKPTEELNDKNAEKQEENNNNNLTEIDNNELPPPPNASKDCLKSDENENEKEKNVPNLNQTIISLSNEKEKEKRQRRGKNETSDRIFKCPDCDKSYLSGPALIIHRKIKHNYNKLNENKSRGRPKKDYQQENSYTLAHNKYNNFFNSNMRKPFLSEENQNNNINNLEQIKNNLDNIFTSLKSDLFSNLDNIEKYNFYKSLIDNWNIIKNETNMESLKDEYYNNDDKKELNYSKCNSPPLDFIFIKYLKEFACNTNKDYFLFINRFIIVFREWINNKKREIIKEEYKTEDKKEFSQIFNAEGIPDYCNDFFVEYLEPNKFFDLNVDEFIELTQHFCFWLFLKKYTPNYLLPLKNKE